MNMCIKCVNVLTMLTTYDTAVVAAGIIMNPYMCDPLVSV